jgi:hypothetical protein
MLTGGCFRLTIYGFLEEKMKKLLLTILVLVVALGSVFAAGGKENPKDGM